MSQTVTLTGGPISVNEVEAVARRGARVELAPEARKRLEASRAALEAQIARGRAIYGVNTGFGTLSKTRIEGDKLAEMQRNLIRSHASGVGDPLPDDAVRAMMLLLAGSLCRGRSGVHATTAMRIVDALNARLIPIVPEVGSVGASGDLSPLSHVVLALIGEGRARVGGRELDGADALRLAGVERLELDAKEGLALINGTHLMAGRAALALADIDRLLGAAITANAMSMEGNKATDSFLDPRVYEARNQPGPTLIATRLRKLLAGSEIVQSHKGDDDTRVQDPYSFRCAPMVLGAAVDSIGAAREAIERELNAVTDNPLVLDGDVVSAGCFHGMPIAIPLDNLAIAISHIAGIAERRVHFTLGAVDEQNPLPAQLSPQPGLHSGMMIAQYAAAACVNELVHLASPSSVINLPTCAWMEDYNSYGPRSASKLAHAINRARSVIAIELLIAAEAMERQRPLKSGTDVERAHKRVRSIVPPLTADRPLSDDIRGLEELIRRGEFGGLMGE